MSRTAKFLDRFGGFNHLKGWFKRLNEAVQQVKQLKKQNSQLSMVVERFEDDFEGAVDKQVSAETDRYKRAYAKKCQEVDSLRRFAPKHPAPKGP